MRNIHREITDKILAMLRTGVAPWRKPWSERVTSHGSVMPRNAVTGRAYSGVNIMLLWSTAEANQWGPRWLTFKQAKEAGGTVRKGETGCLVIFVKRLIVKDEKSADPKAKKTIGFLRGYTVFNVAQCDGLPDSVTGAAPREHKPVNPDGRDADLDAFIAATGVKIVEQGNRAQYLGAHVDRIDMPAFEQFKGAHAYYSTTFHELGHATGHETRLNRKLNNKFGDRGYAAEELIAELTNAFVCAEWGIDMGELPAAYIETWISLLDSREDALVTAASAASKATEWLRGAVAAEEADEEEGLQTAAPALLEAA